MSFLKRLEKIFASPPRNSDRALYINVKCNKCGEELRARVDLWNELSSDFDSGDDASSYHCRKVLVGENKCYQPIELTLEFDRHHRLVKKEIKGGKFLDELEPGN
jgi:hypothetical protein